MALMFRKQRMQDELRPPKPSYVVAQTSSGVEQGLEAGALACFQPSVSLSNRSGALSSALQLLWTQPSEQGCWVHL